LNKLFTVLGGKFEFSAQDSDLEYLLWRSKNPPVSSDLKPPLRCVTNKNIPLRYDLKSEFETLLGIFHFFKEHKGCAMSVHNRPGW
jgi:hypothetical protein